MLLDAKSFDLDVFRFQNLQTGGHPKSKLLASQPDRCLEDVKTFEFDVFSDPKTSNSKVLNIKKHVNIVMLIYECQLKNVDWALTDYTKYICEERNAKGHIHLYQYNFNERNLDTNGA